MEAIAELLVAVILTCALASSANELPQCKDEIDSVMRHKCFANSTVGDTQVRSPPLKWKVIDSKIGRVKVEFPLPNRMCKEYVATLCVNEDVNHSEEECSRPQTTSNCKVHSYRILTQINDRTAFKKDPPICTETGTVMFNYMYTGCYTLQVGCFRHIEPGINYDGNFIETNYKKEIPNYDVQVSFQNYQARNEWQFLVEGIKDIHVVRLELYHNTAIGKEKTCHDFGAPIADMYMRNEEMECSAKIQNKLKPKCIRDNTSITCLVRNITEGHYCILVQMYDDRCRAPPESVWGYKECHYHSIVGEVWNLPLSGGGTIIQPVSPEYVITGCIFSIFVVLCIAVLLYLRMRRTYIRNPGSKLLKSKNSKGLEDQWMTAQSCGTEVPAEIVTESCMEKTKG